MKPEGYIELRFGPRWKYISAARSFIQDFLNLSISDQVKGDKIAVAASELLENSVKYAKGEETSITIKVFPDETGTITLQVENMADEDSIAVLKEIHEKLSQGNPLENYVEQMKSAVSRDDGTSRLGLARIVYETGGKIDLQTTEDGRVIIKLLYH